MKSSLQKDKQDNFASLSEILKSQMKSIVGDRFTKSLSIQNKWQHIVGAVISRHSKILYVKDNILHVAVDNSTWLNELSLMKEQIIQKVHEILPDLQIEEIKLKITAMV